MSESKFSLRPATVVDVPTIMMMVPDYLREVENIELNDEKRELIRANLIKSILLGLVTVLILEKKKGKRLQGIGYGVFDLRPNIFGEVMAWGHHLYIMPEYRNQGLTPMLVNEAERLAHEAGAREFYIDTARPKIFESHLGYGYKYTVVSKQLGGEKHVE